MLEEGGDWEAHQRTRTHRRLTKPRHSQTICVYLLYSKTNSGEANSETESYVFIGLLDNKAEAARDVLMLISPIE